MRGSKAQIYRVIDIDRRIRDRELPRVPYLAVEYEVSESTIRRDIEFLRYRLGAPLEYDRSKRGYTYTEPNWILPAMTLTEGEVLALFVSEQVLQPLKGTPLVTRLRNAIERLTRYLPEQVTIELGELSQLVSYGQAAVPRLELATFDKLVSSTLHHRQIEVTYHSLSSNEVTHNRKLDPYHLACLNGSWFLFAWCHLREDVRMFAPGRISNVAETGVTTTVPSDFSPEAYLAGSFRVVKARESHQVHLRFTPQSAPYVTQKIWHASQQLEERADGSLDLRLELTGLDEIAHWVLGFGAGVKVLAPPALQDKVTDELRRTLAQYPVRASR